MTRYLKISFAFTNLIVVLCGIPLVIIKEKSGISFGAGASIFVIFGYYAFIKFGQSLGFKGVLSPIIYFLSFLLLFTLYSDFQNSNISDKTVILFILTTGMTFFSTLCELIVKSSMRNS